MSSSAASLRPPLAGGAAGAVAIPQLGWMVALIFVHVGLALVFDDFPGLARLHAYGILVAVFWVAILGTMVDRVAYLAGYIVGSEVLWRMASAPLPWEFAKYALSLLFFLSLFRFFPRREGLFIPVLYLAVLMPSLLVSFGLAFDVGELRDALSFNLSGPLSLALAVMFFRQLRLSPQQANGILWAIVIPVCGIAARTLHSILTADRITFTDDANFAASAGFGPNQISAVLGLGALAALLLAVRERRLSAKILSVGLVLWFTTHSFLTFSRGGVYNLVIGGVLAALATARSRGRRVGPIALGAAVIAIMGWLILPRLESFTEQMLKVRFTSLNTTQRGDLASAELRTWAQNPLTGVGPGGLSRVVERTGGDEVAAHTEFTRLLAEHGAGGVIAILLLLLILREGWRRVETAQDRAWLVAFSAWAVVEMAHSAMRLAAIGFCFGLALLRTGLASRVSER